MTIVQTINSNQNIFSHRNTNLAEKIDFLDTMPLPSPKLTRRAGLDYAERVRLENEAFYTPDETLRDYVPGNAPIACEIAKAIRTGYAIEDETGEVSHRFHNLNIFRPGFVSPLNFELKLDNLRKLYESYAGEAATYDAEFDAALDEIANDLTADGGAYAAADKQGVAASIRSIFRSQHSKYSLDDLKAMVVLSQQRLVGDKILDPNEFVLGVLLGYEASAIIALRNSAKLSDNAVETIWNEFTTHIEDVIRTASKRVEWAKQDPFRNKSRGYSPIDEQIIYRSIAVMLDAPECESFNKGIRKSLSELDETYRRHVCAQIESGILDQRFNCGTLYWHFGGPVGDVSGHNNTEWSVRSSYFARYFDLPNFALRGNIFGKTNMPVI